MNKPRCERTNSWAAALRATIISVAVIAPLILISQTAPQTGMRGRQGNPHGPLTLQCQNCHTTTSWRPIRQTPEFDHNAQTKFPLIGMHRGVNCADCHRNLVFTSTPARCADCHADIHWRQFGANCAACHTVRAWTPANFNAETHSARFPLIGSHASAACISCHKGIAAGQFTGLSIQCAACHMADYNAATAVNHKTAGFPIACENCHGVAQWSKTRFGNANNHAAFGFSLTGAHSQIACALCHVNNNFNLTSKECITCHLANYSGTTNPNHVAAGFPRDCTLCHGTSSWLGSAFNHASTGFTLNGAHASAACAKCHVNNNFNLTNSQCAACHLAQYNATTNPNHKAAGFPQDCSICHGVSTWTGAVFNHSTTKFPLTGAHVSVACGNCHLNGQYSGTPTACYSCHGSEYRSVANPNHVAAGFPTTCNDCHNTSSWLGAVFTHTAFPIYSGSHQGKWSSCSDCHTNASNYKVFSCVTCHAHDKATMDSHHQQVRNYVYDSANCYSCHPQGRAD